VRRRQPRTHKQAIVWAALVVGVPLAVYTILNAAFDETLSGKFRDGS
jgi:hypothetical protein